MQCIGRVLRKNEGKEIGRIVIVVVVPDDVADALTDEQREQLLADSQAFQPVFAVLNTLEQHDFVVRETMQSYRLAGQKPRKIPIKNGRSVRITVKGIDGLPSDLTRTLEQSVKLVAARKAALPKDKYADWEAWQKREDWISDVMKTEVSEDDAARYHDLTHPEQRETLIENLINEGRTRAEAETELDGEATKLNEHITAAKRDIAA